MAELFVIGLPNALQRRIETRAVRVNKTVNAIPIGTGKKGSPYFLPHADHAIHALAAQLNRAGSHHVLVLPYVDPPIELIDELNLAVSMGIATATYIANGAAGWPVFQKKNGLDQAFLDELFTALSLQLFGTEVLPPTEHLKNLSDLSDRVLFNDLIEQANDVANHRYTFMRNAGDALLELCQRDGNVGTLKDFFSAKGLEFAHSGGIETLIEVFDVQGSRVLQRRSHDHLKQGDNTTAHAAARVYFQHFTHDSVFYIAIIYAGPHPDNDITFRIDLKKRE